jgi:hypothetical protein
MTAASMRTTIVCLGLASCLSSYAHADTLLTTHGNLLAVTDQPVPGPSGAYFGATFDNPVIADDGTVLFRANMYGGDVSGPANAWALFRGTTAANLSMMVRSSDPAPGLASLMLVNGAGNNGIQAGSRLSPDGRTFWSSYLSGPGVASNNDTAMFGGLPGSLIPIAREGDAAPGTSGAVFSGDRITSAQFTTMNKNGAVLFQSNLSGGDVVGATNNLGLFTGAAGALSMVVRKGATVLPGPVTASSFPGQLLMDSAGRVLYSMNLSGTGVSTGNDASLWLYTPGSGNTLLVREGQVAPGTAGATFANSFDTWQPALSIDGFNNTGQYEMTVELQGGDVVAGVNDQALYVGSASGLTMVARKGAPAPGTDALFGGFVTNNTYINNAGAILTVANLMGGTSSASNSSAVYLATPTGIPAAPYTLSLVMRAGDPAPGTPGDIFGPSFNQIAAFNDSGQAVFNRDLRGGDAMFGINDKGLYAWDPVKGLYLLARSGDQIEVVPDLFWTAYNFAYQSNSNTDGSAIGLSKTGTLAMNVGWFDGGSSVVTLDLSCYPVYYPDADGDGYGDASSTNGVCSNASPPAGYVPNHTDCNDANSAVYKTYYLDADGDGYGDAATGICGGATPPAGYVLYGTDCNVADPSIHPDRSDDSCDGVDQNCNGVNDEEYLTHQSTCGVGACASLGVAQCSNGVVNDTCAPGAPTTETCNGIDDNCDGTIDNAAVPTGTPSVTLSRISGGAATLTWSGVSAATGYDVARGALQTLRSTGGSFSAATTGCLGDNLGSTTVNDLQSPAVGQGFWYAVRAVNCGGNASYDSGSPKQVASRDAGIAASGHGCP